MQTIRSASTERYFIGSSEVEVHIFVPRAHRTCHIAQRPIQTDTFQRKILSKFHDQLVDACEINVRTLHFIFRMQREMSEKLLKSHPIWRVYEYLVLATSDQNHNDSTVFRLRFLVVNIPYKANKHMKRSTTSPSGIRVRVCNIDLK